MSPVAAGKQIKDTLPSGVTYRAIALLVLTNNALIIGGVVGPANPLEDAAGQVVCDEINLEEPGHVDEQGSEWNTG